MRRGIWNVSVLLCLVLLVPMVSSGQSPSINYYPAAAAGGVTVLNTQYADSTCGSSGAEVTLYTYTLPAGMLARDGDLIRVLAWGVAANNANTKTVSIYFGATAVQSRIINASYQAWTQSATVIRTGAATQRAVGEFASVATAANNAANNSQNGTFVTAPTETLANAIALTIKVNCATAASDLTAQGWIVEFARR